MTTYGILVTTTTFATVAGSDDYVLGTQAEMLALAESWVRESEKERGGRTAVIKYEVVPLRPFFLRGGSGGKQA